MYLTLSVNMKKILKKRYAGHTRSVITDSPNCQLQLTVQTVRYY